MQILDDSEGGGCTERRNICLYILTHNGRLNRTLDQLFLRDASEHLMSLSPRTPHSSSATIGGSYAGWGRPWPATQMLERPCPRKDSSTSSHGRSTMATRGFCELQTFLVVINDTRLRPSISLRATTKMNERGEVADDRAPRFVRWRAFAPTAIRPRGDTLAGYSSTHISSQPRT